MTARPPLRDVLAVLPAVLLLLPRLRWLHPRRDVAGLLAAATPGPRAGGLSLERAQVALRVSHALIRRLPRLFPQPCLYWSLAACHFLRRAKKSPVMHVGVRSEDGELMSHAWVTVEGQWVAGQPDPSGYGEIISLP